MLKRLTLLLLVQMLPSIAWADGQCSMKVNDDFAITGEIPSYDPSEIYSLITNPRGGSASDTLLWANVESVDGNVPIVYEDDLTAGTSYLFRFTYDKSEQLITYYVSSDAGNLWQAKESKNVSFSNDSQTDIQIKGEGTKVNCDEGTIPETPTEPEPPTELPDICQFVPGTLQTNYYPSGTPYGNLFISGEDTEIILPKDDYEMSFFSLSATYDACIYPSSGAKEACKVSAYSIEGYPIALEDKFTGNNLTIAAGQNQTLDTGEYWFDTVTFGGDGSKLNITGEVILHYKTLIIPQTGENSTIYINDGGDSKQMLMVGHGNNASITTTTKSAAIKANAHFYIDNGSAQGISLAGNNSYITGGISANSVSLSGRLNHIDGNGGCGSPETPTVPDPDIDLCDYFPEPAQSWKTGSSLAINNADQQIIGWSDNYVSNHLYQAQDTTGNGAADTVSTNKCTVGDVNCVLKVGFDNMTELGSKFSNMACENGACYSGGEKIEVPTEIDPDFTSTKEITIDDWASREQCIDGGVTYCTVTGEGSGTYTITILKSLKSLTVNAWSSAKFNIIFESDSDDEQFGLKIETVSLAGNTSNLNASFIGDGRFTFGSATITSGQISSTGQVVLFLTQGLSVTNPFTTAMDDDGGDFIIYGPEANVAFSGSGQEMKLKILADSVRFNNSAALYGAVTANNLYMSEPNTYIIADKGMCSGEVVDDNYEISMTPEIDYSLMCGTDAPAFVVITKNNGEATSLGVNAEIFPEENSDDFNVTVQEGVGSGTFPNFLSDSNGELGLTIAVSNPENVELNKEYTLKVTLASDSSLTASSQFIYVPFKFKAEDQLVIADKPNPVDVSVVGCSADDGSEVLITNYSGTPTISHSLDIPSSGSGELAFAPTLENGVSTEATKDLTFDNSGVVNVTLEDSDFDCSGLEDCPIDGGGVLKGNFIVKSRPWTFAICSPTGDAMNGDSEGGSGFVAAGEEFALRVAPIVWQHGGSETEPVEVSSYCGVDVTTNYFLSDATPATLELDSGLDTPIEGRLGNGLESATELTRLNTEKAGNHYFSYDDLSWQEVGSLKVTADALDNYLGMTINQGYRNIGRFYPHHLALESNTWNYAVGHSGFAYMNQPIGTDYTVKAKNAQNEDTQNYGFFAPSLQAKMRLIAVNTNQNNAEISAERYTIDTEQAWSQADYQYSTHEFVFYKSMLDSSPYTSEPDGPYDDNNTLWGVLVTDETVDDVNFDFSRQDASFSINNIGDEAIELFSQPDFRYGRMVLSNVSGPIGGPISVPLRIEYWDGSSFVTNSDDSGSHFKTDVYYVMSNMNESTAKLTSTTPSSFITAQNGKSNRVQAKQGSASREAVRLFLRQGNDSEGYGNNSAPKEDDDFIATNDGWKNPEDIKQPWLQFNWRNKGDEDPSTVVNFGAYRGNDRIIYRGEPNLTGK